jgi:hypothetical protein
VEQMMMVIPVNANVDKAQHITEKAGEQGSQRSEARPVWNLQLQYHDGDDDGHYAIAECLKPTFSHCCLSETV